VVGCTLLVKMLVVSSVFTRLKKGWRDGIGALLCNKPLGTREVRTGALELPHKLSHRSFVAAG
jgi:hypothetical protein